VVDSIIPLLCENIVKILEHYMSGSIKKEYDDNGHLIKESHFISGKLNRVTTYWNDNRKIAEIEYKDDKRHGVSREWYANGKLNAQWYNKNGKRDGQYISWWENGNKKEEGFFKDGKRKGTYIWYDFDGKIIQEHIYK
jgi:antitoxin component YwqK of YwqJK toxin-antitoxin module